MLKCLKKDGTRVLVSYERLIQRICILWRDEILRGLFLTVYKKLVLEKIEFFSSRKLKKKHSKMEMENLGLLTKIFDYLDLLEFKNLNKERRFWIEQPKSGNSGSLSENIGVVSYSEIEARILFWLVYVVLKRNNMNFVLNSLKSMVRMYGKDPKEFLESNLNMVGIYIENIADSLDEYSKFISVDWGKKVVYNITLFEWDETKYRDLPYQKSITKEFQDITWLDKEMIRQLCYKVYRGKYDEIMNFPILD